MRHAILVSLVSIAIAAPVRAETIVIEDPDIGTDLGGGVTTRVTRITVNLDSGPWDCADSAASRRVTGSISGIGRGGHTFALVNGALVSQLQSRDKAYAYTVDFQLLHPEKGQSAVKTLVQFFHGGGNNIVGGLDAERANGAANGGRAAYLDGDGAVGRAAVANHAAYFSVNRRLRTGGAVVGTYLPESGPWYTTDLAARVAARYPALPGVTAGAPLPLEAGLDITTMRDVAHAAKLVHAAVLGRTPRYTIGIGVSTGGVLLLEINSGRDTANLRSGGNFARAYLPSSGTVFDYFIVRGAFVPGGPEPGIDPEFPLTAPTVVTMGNADFRSGLHWKYLARLGVPLAEMTRIYEWRGATHRWASDEGRCRPSGTIVPSDLGPQAPFMGALIANARERLSDGWPEPISRYAGHLDAHGALVFERSEGVTNQLPMLDDPGDTINVALRTVSAEEQASWRAVDQALPHGQAIVPPLVECRLGTFALIDNNVTGGRQQLTPYPDLLARWPSFDGFKLCVEDQVDALESERLYDPRLETARTTARRYEDLWLGAAKPQR